MVIRQQDKITPENVIKNVLATEIEGDKSSQSRRVRFVARLTSLLGMLLFFLLALEGVSVPLVGELLTWHVVVGVILIPVMTAKIVVTSYRFALYYTKSLDFKKAGPPWMPLRVIGPLIVLSTVGLMVSGVVLMVIGPNSPSVNLWIFTHRATFIAWSVFMSAHVASYVRRAATVSWKDLKTLSVGDSLKSSDSWYRFIIVIVTLAIGIGLATKFGQLTAPWLAHFAPYISGSKG